MKKRILSMVLVLALVLTMLPAMAISALAETINDDNVFVKQSGSGKCTLASSVMMLRRRAIVDGNVEWDTITESSLGSVAWISGTGLRNSFSYMNMTVGVDYYSGMSLDNKKAAFIALLDKHPEGFVIYDTGIPHAVLLTDYDSATGTFYCADPANGTASGRIKLSQSWNAQKRGGTQDSVISNISKIWYITNKEGGGPGLITVTLDPNGGSCSQTTAYVTADGAINGLPTPTREGFRFLGWFTAPVGGRNINNGEIIHEDITLYAQWKDMTVRGTCGTGLSWSLNLDIGTLKITGAGEMASYTSARDLSAPWSEYAGYITKVQVGSGVKSIGDYAFANLTKLTTVELSGSAVKKLGDCAFSGCTSLSDISGLNGIKVIGAECFKGCSALKGITVPTSCTSIGRSAFAQSGLTSILLPASVTSLGEGAFSGCKAMTLAQLPSTIAKISSDSFRNCTALAAVIIGDEENTVYVSGDSVIETNAFYGCTALHEFSIYNRFDSLTVAFNAFAGCKALQSMSLDCRKLSLENNALPSGAKPYYVRVNGELGTIAPKAFDGVSTSIVYPKNGTAWSNEVGKNYGGTLTWEGWDNHVHDFATVTVAPTCSTKGYTVYTCKSASCNESFTANYKNMLGHNFVNGKCTVCNIENPFTDIDAKGRHLFYTDAILWAAKNDITQGITPTTFSPDGNCTRAQVVTFLWRMAGSPDPKGSGNPFADVSESAYYYKPVLWAVENGITQGMSENSFAPDGTCTRAQFVTFLWRYLDKPVSGGDNPFTDVPSNAYYYQPVLWAAEAGVTQGYGGGIFAPNDTCIRGQVVTFIYRSQT